MLQIPYFRRRLDTPLAEGSSEHKGVNDLDVKGAFAVSFRECILPNPNTTTAKIVHHFALQSLGRPMGWTPGQASKHLPTT